MREGALDVKKWVILLACTTLLFAGLWLYESADPFDTQRMEELCQKEAESAAEAFQNYQQFREINRNEGEYWGAVSRFYAFKEMVLTLYGNRWKDSIYPDADGIYDFMIFRPELVQEHLEEVVAALEIVGEDWTAPEARRALSQLSYDLQYVWK